MGVVMWMTILKECKLVGWQWGVRVLLRKDICLSTQWNVSHKDHWPQDTAAD